MACRECEGKGMCEYCFNLGDTNPLQAFGIINKQEWDETQAEITILKEQLARTERERDQATKEMIAEEGQIYVKDSEGWLQSLDTEENRPDLYAHLAGKVN